MRHQEMFYSFDALNCCVVCALFFLVQASLLLYIDLALNVISTIFLFIYFFFGILFLLLLWFPIFYAFFFCCCITSFFNTGMHFYINSGFLLFCGGCSDLLVRFAFFILQLALCSGGVFCLEIYLIGSLCICCLLCSVYCLWHILLIYFTFIYLTFLISSIQHYGIVVLWA